ncbi:MAG: HNH endonuclease [Bacteroidales bacterium]|nr:HNH endonuclease [Bacteroidales bacterium]
MKEGQRLWTKDELILVLNLYCKLPFGRLHKLNPDVIDLAVSIDRTPSSVAYKLVNFASLDPSLKVRGIRGAKNSSKLDKETWDEFFEQIDISSYQSEKILASLKHTTIEKLHHISEDEMPKEGKIRERLIKTRVNQSFFRSMILAAYNHTCCITGINQPDFLIAGHIRPWGIDEKNRLNPRNGIALNALHDKAFELGYITITTDYRVRVSPLLLEKPTLPVSDFINKYDNREIILPSKFLPDLEFLKYHNQERFRS